MLVDRDEIIRLVNQFGTPLWLLDTGCIISTMNRLRDGFLAEYSRCEITYSVKTNYLAEILREVAANGYRLEVVSGHELALARQVGVASDRLLFNGPVKSSADLKLCHSNRIDVHVDSLDELSMAAELGSKSNPFRLGIRVAARLANGSTSRFGIDFEDANSVKTVRGLIAGNSVAVTGFHMHHSSRRNAQSYCERIDRLLEVARLLNVQPEYIDIGGGIGSELPPEISALLTYPIDSHDSFAKTVGVHARENLADKGIRLILEPGIGVLANSMNYITTIVSTKSRGEGQIAVCDGSMFEVNPLRSTIQPPCYLLDSGSIDPHAKVSSSTQLFGATCMEIDQIGKIESARLPERGDLVIVTNTGAYTCSLSPEFIVPQAPVWSIRAKAICRNRQTQGNFSGAGE